MSDWQQERQCRDRARRDEVLSLPVLPLRRHGVIDGPGGDVLACASAGPADDVATVWTTPDGRAAVTSATVSAAGTSFPDPAAARPVAASITVHTPELAALTRIADLTLAHITVQLMPGGRFLVARARCRWRPEGPDRNAVLYDTDGQVVSEHVLGNGIAHMLATSTGQVGPATSTRAFTATTAGAGRQRRARRRVRNRPVLPRPGARLALPEVHRGRPVGRDRRLLRPQRR